MLKEKVTSMVKVVQHEVIEMMRNDTSKAQESIKAELEKRLTQEVRHKEQEFTGRVRQ